MSDERREDTDPSINILEQILTALRDIKKELGEVRERLSGLEDRQKEMDSQLRNLIVDVNVVHELQKTFNDRVGGLEKMCVQKPLRSTPLPRSARSANNGKK